MVAKGDQIKWPDTRNLGVRVDALAAALRTPDYVGILTDITTPFPLPDKVPAKPTCEFSIIPPEGRLEDFLTDHTPMVQQQRLMKDVGAASFPMTLPEPLATLARQQDLFFLHSQDDCWCKTLFQVLAAPDGTYYLREVSSPEYACSCQSLFVPQNGSRLGYDQNIIPAAYATDWAIRTHLDVFEPADEWETADRCEDSDAPKVYFRFAQFLSDKYKSLDYMSHAQRPMDGSFVWPIRAKWFDKLYDKLEFILDCRRNCGSTGVPLYSNTSEIIPIGCPVTLCDALWTMRVFGAAIEPGCIVDACKRPWHVPTCGGEICAAGDGMSMYALTVNQLGSLIDSIPNWVRPKSDSCAVPVPAQWEFLGEAKAILPPDGYWQGIQLCMVDAASESDDGGGGGGMEVHVHPELESQCFGIASTTFCVSSDLTVSIDFSGLIEAVRPDMDSLQIRVSYEGDGGVEIPVIEYRRASKGYDPLTPYPGGDVCESSNYETVFLDTVTGFIPAGDCRRVTITMVFDTLDNKWNCGVGYKLYLKLT